MRSNIVRNTMHVHLKLGSRQESVRNISLLDGYRPVVDGLPPSSTSGPFHIDCALWYKTYIVESVYIDCDNREVHWIRKDSTLLKTIYDSEDDVFVPSEAEKLISDVDVYDFDPTVDELTNVAHACMTSYMNKKMTWKDLCSEVARLLHCYVFPAIKFKKDDMRALQDALMLIESKSECIEAEIFQKSRSIDHIEISLHNQRKRIVANENFQSEIYVRSCKKEFLLLFCKDIEKDVLRLNGQFEGTQLQVNKYRDCNVLEGTQIKLEELRKRRDEIHEELKSLQHAKETLRNVLFRRSVLRKKVLRKIKVKTNVFHEIYLEVSARLRQQKEDLQKSCLGKVKISSVREAIFTNFTELKAPDEDYVSTYPSDGTEFNLDILGIVPKPEGWKTLEEKVCSMLENRTSPICHSHHQACKVIKDKIACVIGDTKMFSSSTEDCVSINGIDVQFIEVVGESSRQRRSGRARSSRVVMPESDLSSTENHLAAESLKRSMRGIRDDVIKQIKITSEMLLQSLPNSDGSQNFNKVWVSYENIFYLEMLPYLCELYKLSYENKCRNLYKKISSLTLEDILQDDKIVSMILATMESDNPLTPNCLRRRRANSLCSAFELLDSCESDECRTSAVSIEIKKCTLQELYSMADNECGQLTGSIVNLMDETRCGPPGSVDEETRLSRGEITCNDVLPSTEKEVVPGSDEDEEDVFVGEDLEEEEDSNVGEPQDVQAFLDNLFQSIKASLQTMFKASTVLARLRHLTKVFRSLGNLLSDLSEKTATVCCDEMLSIIIILLRGLDEETFVQLYANVNLLIDLRAPFLSGSVHDCSLTNFLGAFDYLFSVQLCCLSGSSDNGCVGGYQPS